MARTNCNRNIHVAGSDERQSPEQLRRVGRALIALARAQLEAEAQAAHTTRKTAGTSMAKRPRKSA
jgi:hypothetical protein